MGKLGILVFKAMVEFLLKKSWLYIMVMGLPLNKLEFMLKDMGVNSKRGIF